VRRSAALLFASVLLASCASGSGADVPSTTRAGAPSAPSSESAAAATTTTATTIAGEVAPERIIPLDGDVAEIVFALGLGDRVVATDLSATYPPEADALPQIGYQRALNAEPILEFDPTLVIGTDIAGPPEAIEELERVGVPVVIVPTPSDATGPGTKIRAIAAALGVPDAGERLATSVESAIAAATPSDPSNSPAAGLRVAMLYLRGSSTQLLFGQGTSIDWLIEATGAVNVADEMGIVETADITAEALIAAAPDVLLVTEDGLASVGGLDGLVALPSLAATPAAQHRAVLAYDAQLMLGNGPRTGDFLAQLMLDLTDIRARLDDTNTDAETDNTETDNTDTDNTDTDNTDTDKETP
jgi:iron complex transport system substrate-binding protein